MRCLATTILFLGAVAAVGSTAVAQSNESTTPDREAPQTVAQTKASDVQAESTLSYEQIAQAPKRGKGMRMMNQDESAAEKAPDPREQIKRGEYLTHSVAMCVICHSPKDERGNPIQGQEFRGGAIPVSPIGPKMAEWAKLAPALGPLASGAGDDVVGLLTTGVWPRTGQPPKPPMPPFRLTEEDAKAVVAYLQSLKQ